MSKTSYFTPEFVAELRQEMLQDNKNRDSLHTRNLNLSIANERYVKEFRISRDEINQAYASILSDKK